MERVRRGTAESLVFASAKMRQKYPSLFYRLKTQKPEVKNQVFAALQNAITNYLTIRSCTGMSIKELLDYAVKSSGGQLPKESFVPVTGYITPGAKPNAPEDNK